MKFHKDHIRDYFSGSNRLFEACYRQYLKWLREGAIDTPVDICQVVQWVDSIAAEKVNNPRSSFYIYGR